MKPLLTVRTLALALVLALCLPSAAAWADRVVTIIHGQTFQGDVLAREPIRITFPLPVGGEPRLRFTLFGTRANQPSSFQVKLYDPDGAQVTLPPGSIRPTYSTGVNTFRLRRWKAEQSGYHTLVITHVSLVQTRAEGKLTVARPKVYRFEGDETTVPNSTTGPVSAFLQPNDGSSVSVKRVTGTAPRVAAYTRPRLPTESGTDPTVTVLDPPQRAKRSGSVSYVLGARSYGTYTYDIGYQPGETVGAWKAKLRVKHDRGGGAGPAELQRVNPPGVDLTVNELVDSYAVTFGDSGCGVVFDGAVLVVTSERNGAVSAMRIATDLSGPVGIATPTVLTSTVDFQPAQATAGHRLLRLDGATYLAYSSASGDSVAVREIRNDLVTSGAISLVAAAASPVFDFFLTGQTTELAVGVPNGAAGHDLYRIDVSGTNFAALAPVAIGGTPAQSWGSGADWNPDGYFELWTPESHVPGAASDLHLQTFEADWTPRGGDAVKVAAAETETNPTSVLVDPQTGVTIVHYVVPDNPPLDEANPGPGRIHRRLFDTSGAEIPGSHVVVSESGRDRPAAILVGDALYLASEGAGQPRVERYYVLRTDD